MTVKASVTWTTGGMPSFLKSTAGAPSAKGIEGPTMASAYTNWAATKAIPEGIETGMNRLAAQMEAYAQAEAPWKDQTGKARKGLHGFVIVDGREVAATISHAQDVDYGIWLETRWAGRYAIILPTQEIFARKAKKVVMDELALELRGRGSKFRHRVSGQFA